MPSFHNDASDRQVSLRLKRLRRSQVEDIDLIDDIEAIERLEPRKKAEVALWRKRAEVSEKRMQGFGFRDWDKWD